MSEKFQQIKALIIEKTKSHYPQETVNEILEQSKALLENSDTLVYCVDCGMIFYTGKPDPIIYGNSFYDFKMLAFRHAWNTHHTIKVALSYFQGSPFRSLLRAVPYFEADGQINYSKSVEERRHRLIDCADERAYQTHDANWDANSRCTCVICNAQYYDPKDACLCHSEQKPWLPMQEVNSIQVPQ